MPATAAAEAPPSAPEKLAARLSSGEAGESLLTALREIKNQIIGNRTKKLVYLRLHAVPRIVALLSAPSSPPPVIVQAAAAVGSFACGVEEGVRAVLDAGAVPHLTMLLSHPDAKVIDSAARTLRIIFQSKMAPKYDFLLEENKAFLLSLLNSTNENITEFAASIIAHSCEKPTEQTSLCDAGVMQKLVYLLGGSTNQRDTCLDAISAIVRTNSDAAAKFISIGNGKAFNSLMGLIQDRYPRTRLLACVCLITVERAFPVYFQEMQIKSKLIVILLDLIEEAGRVGDDAPFVLKGLIEESEELHRQALSVTAAERLCGYMRKGKAVLEARRLEGILLVLGELSSKLEQSRAKLIELQVPTLVIDLLKHDCAQVRTAACCVIKNISRSLKNLCAGRFGTESTVMPLVQLLCDSSTSVQTSALDAICNVAVNLTTKKSVLLQCGGVSTLSQLARSMHSEVRLKSVRALRNLMFLLDRKDKDFIFTELTASTLTTLISDPDPLVQEQALALAGNFVDGCGDSTKYIFSEDISILNAVSRQLKSAGSPGMCIQGMSFLANIAAENDLHKDAVMDCILPVSPDLNISTPNSFLVNFLQSKERLLRLSSLWCLVNLVYPNHKNSLRVSALHSAGIISQLKTMVNDPCLDCKVDPFPLKEFTLRS
ncbi:armadillo repeat-containing protein 8 isoform X1 [Carex littledalei]|uniref:Armadillo repeat-containing protein 8 isoform X1 n=1 Tax=Carex littledalei TaxID=544730 RepID=A0A833VWB6_9POAL|nr:armadillo repeat-containing protein 8 isoform X1 [Carex littledalei]